MTRKDATTGGLSPASAHAEAGRAHRRRAELVAGGVLVTLALLVVVGWWLAPGESGNAVGTLNPTPHPPRGDATLAYTAVTAPTVSGAVTATILAVMILGAAAIGLAFFAPAPDQWQRPRRSGAVVNSVALHDHSRVAPSHSSSALGAVLETVIRNSTLLLVFLSRSTSRSMA
ncbi:hypothetical protein D7D52_15025 [Nocardia yunnanensis]|uniref:Uncharacterized protein n=1 Tax=Nocardia yunnanensis TaxID=2382165 RepID=A0A386ZCQ8_9NOCA|nr:hypothetical protein [Nocardia yunnanensis]AYF74953.1 hypothetical protein D7D52_15025 [Nocardia yunnanensis]